MSLDNKRIVFVNPPYERIAPGYEFVKHITNRSPSLGLLHLAAEVRLHGFEPSIIESDILGLNAEQAAERAIATRPAFVGITLFTVGVWGASIAPEFDGSPHAVAEVAKSRGWVAAHIRLTISMAFGDDLLRSVWSPTERCFCWT